MRKQDIRVGEEYAYQRHTYATPMRVKVIDLNGSVTQGYSYNRRTIKGITFEFLTGVRKGQTEVATGRQIARTWPEQEAIEKAAEEARQYRENAAREVAARRAELASRIEKVMEAHGEESAPRYLGRNATRIAALKAAGFEVTVDEHVRARFDVGNLMAEGTVSEKTLRVLLADQPVALTRKGEW